MNANTRKIPFCVVFLLLAGLVVSGCATRKTSTSDSTADGYGVESDRDRETMTPAERFTYDYRSAALARMQEDESVPLSKAMLIETAKTAIGTPYVRGGSNTEGFDCSGFVQWAYKHVGVKLPRTAREQATVGTPVRNFDDMVAGDIVAFRHPRRGYHTGIYVGDGKFIHSPRKRTRVRINSLSDPYFNSTFLGARRVEVDDDDIGAAQTLLAAYESGKGHLQQTKTDARSSKESAVLDQPARKKKSSTSKSSGKSSSKSSSKKEKSKKMAAQTEKNRATKSSKSTKAGKAEKVEQTRKSEKTAQARKSGTAKKTGVSTSQKKKTVASSAKSTSKSKEKASKTSSSKKK